MEALTTNQQIKRRQHDFKKHFKNVRTILKSQYKIRLTRVEYSRLYHSFVKGLVNDLFEKGYVELPVGCGSLEIVKDSIANKKKKEFLLNKKVHANNMTYFYQCTYTSSKEKYKAVTKFFPSISIKKRLEQLRLKERTDYKPKKLNYHVNK